MRHILFCVLIFLYLPVLGEDIIVLRSGDIINSRVLEITQTEIKYKKSSNPSGPIYTISKSEVLSITYENGSQDKFIPTQPSLTSISNNGPSFIERRVDSVRNLELLSLYKRPHDFYKGKNASTKTTNKGTAFFAFTRNSVLSNEDIEFSIHPVVLNHFYASGNCLKEAADKYGTYYRIRLTNKTNRPLYIDCANCYIMDGDGDFTTFYDSKTYSETHGGSKSGYLNLGGITNPLGIGGLLGSLANSTTIGTTSMSGINVTNTDSRVLIIPPMGYVDLPSKKYLGKNQVFERPEYFPRPHYESIIMKKWVPQYFEEGDLPSYLRFCFTYSDSPSFDVYSTIQSELYCYEIMGQLFDYYPKSNLHNSEGVIIFKRMDDGKPLYAPIYEQIFGKPIY